MLQIIVFFALASVCFAGKNCTNDLECQWFVELCQYGECKPNGKYCASPAECPSPLQCRYSHCAYPVWPKNIKMCNDDLQCTWFVELCQFGQCVTNGRSCLSAHDCDAPMECRWSHCGNPVRPLPTYPPTPNAPVQT
uniref:C3H1-type domain-containing protein n=1 Tax=Syphacia muris TaxID=451379 RepID=A0A0N5ACU2_9BILA